MCVNWKGEWEKAGQDMIAFKLCRVAHGKYVSAVPASSRFPQDEELLEDHTTGTEVEYVIGSVMEDSGYGFYMVDKLGKGSDLDRGDWGAKEMLEFYGRFYPEVVMLQVLIPEGAEIRRGRSGKLSQGINARKIKVLGVINVHCI